MPPRSSLVNWAGQMNRRSFQTNAGPNKPLYPHHTDRIPSPWDMFPTCWLNSGPAYVNLAQNWASTSSQTTSASTQSKRDIFSSISHAHRLRQSDLKQTSWGRCLWKVGSERNEMWFAGVTSTCIRASVNVSTLSDPLCLHLCVAIHILFLLLGYLNSNLCSRMNGQSMPSWIANTYQRSNLH